jgi:hypothetical protein
MKRIKIGQQRSIERKRTGGVRDERVRSVEQGFNLIVEKIGKIFVDFKLC